MNGEVTNVVHDDKTNIILDHFRQRHIHSWQFVSDCNSDKVKIQLLQSVTQAKRYPS